MKNDTCVFCGGSNSVEHTVFSCNKGRGIREMAYAKLGSELDPDEMVDFMV